MERAAATPFETGMPVIPQGITGGSELRETFAAIDLGTNNCRLLVARRSGRGFRIIDAFSRIVRLGEGLAQSNRLSDAAMDRTDRKSVV